MNALRPVEGRNCFYLWNWFVFQGEFCFKGTEVSHSSVTGLLSAVCREPSLFPQTAGDGFIQYLPLCLTRSLRAACVSSVCASSSLFPPPSLLQIPLLCSLRALQTKVPAEEPFRCKCASMKEADVNTCSSSNTRGSEASRGSAVIIVSNIYMSSSTQTDKRQNSLSFSNILWLV